MPIWRVAFAYIFFWLVLAGAVIWFKPLLIKHLLFWRFLLVMLTLLSTIFPILKRNVGGDFPELYPGFIMPLHFIFTLNWFVFEPKILHHEQ
jgi:hypothetical protein